MIQALPQQLNRVILQNPARTQQVQGLVWIGELRRPLLTIVKLNPGDKPISVDGYDLLLAEDGLAAYGDKRLIRYTMDAEIDAKNRLLFFGISPGWAEGNLARWLARKGGDTLSNDGVLRMGQFIREGAGSQNILTGWCIKEADLFQPTSNAYLVYAEPPPNTLHTILQAAQTGEDHAVSKKLHRGKKLPTEARLPKAA